MIIGWLGSGLTNEEGAIPIKGSLLVEKEDQEAYHDS